MGKSLSNIIIILMFASSNMFAQNFPQNIIPSFVLERVLYIKYNQSTGSSFAIEKDGRTLILTAKHIFPNLQENNSITFEVMQNKVWRSVTGIAHFHSNPNLDAMVIDLGYSFFQDKRYEDYLTGNGHIIFGDDCYFFGYPLTLQTEMQPTENDGYPIPLIKKAIFSGQMEINGLRSPFLDGNNTPGFSGGPIFIKSYEKGTGKSSWYLLGLISGYYLQVNTIPTSQGNWSYSENSGIISVSDIGYINEIIKNIH